MSLRLAQLRPELDQVCRCGAPRGQDALTHTKLLLDEVFALLIRQQLDHLYRRRRASRGSRITIPSSHLLKVGGQQGHLVEIFFIRGNRGDIDKSGHKPAERGARRHQNLYDGDDAHFPFAFSPVIFSPNLAALLRMEVGERRSRSAMVSREWVFASAISSRSLAIGHPYLFGFLLMTAPLRIQPRRRLSGKGICSRAGRTTPWYQRFVLTLFRMLSRFARDCIEFIVRLSCCAISLLLAPLSANSRNLSSSARVQGQEERRGRSVISSPADPSLFFCRAFAIAHK